MYKYGIFRKKDWKCLLLCKNYLEAKYMLKRQTKGLCEIRKIIGWDGKHGLDLEEIKKEIGLSTISLIHLCL